MGMSGIGFTKSVESPAHMLLLRGTPATVADLALGKESAGDTGRMQSTEFSDFQQADLSSCHPSIPICPASVSVR